jgi:hypothetical protein
VLILVKYEHINTTRKVDEIIGDSGMMYYAWIPLGL